MADTHTNKLSHPKEASFLEVIRRNAANYTNETPASWSSIKMCGNPNVINSLLTKAAAIRLGLEGTDATITRYPIGDLYDPNITQAVYHVKQEGHLDRYFSETSISNHRQQGFSRTLYTPAYPRIQEIQEPAARTSIRTSITDSIIKDIYHHQIGTPGYVPLNPQLEAIKKAFHDKVDPPAIKLPEQISRIAANANIVGSVALPSISFLADRKEALERADKFVQSGELSKAAADAYANAIGKCQLINNMTLHVNPALGAEFFAQWVAEYNVPERLATELNTTGVSMIYPAPLEI